MDRSRDGSLRKAGRGRRVIVSLLELAFAVVLVIGSAFLFSMRVMGDDWEGPGYGRRTEFGRWFGDLAEAAIRNPLLWYGVGVVIVLGTATGLLMVSVRVGRSSRRDA